MRLRNTSIRQKIILVMVFLSSCTIIAMGLGFQIVEFQSSRSASLHQIDILSEIIGTNSSAALVFGDKVAAQGVLAPIRVETDVTHACIFDSHDELFAAYSRDPKNPCSSRPLNAASSLRMLR